MKILEAKNLKGITKIIRTELYHTGEDVVTDTWQGSHKDVQFKENQNVMISVTNPWPTGEDPLRDLLEFTEANKNWAPIHFEERVCGHPLNPAPSHTLWYSKSQDYTKNGKYSHTYPERFWPKSLLFQGIRFRTGDLGDLVKLLKENLFTRGAYLPMFSMEDITAGLENERTPCSLGWHFMIRRDLETGRLFLNLNYYMRSCDVVRHVQNDIYFAIRLADWVLTKLTGQSANSAGVRTFKHGDNQEIIEMGEFNMLVTSLHFLQSDHKILEGMIK